jgi:hypothetical protein
MMKRGAVTGRYGRERGNEGKWKEQGKGREEEGRHIRDEAGKKRGAVTGRDGREKRQWRHIEGAGTTERGCREVEEMKQGCYRRKEMCIV